MIKVFYFAVNASCRAVRVKCTAATRGLTGIHVQNLFVAKLLGQKFVELVQRIVEYGSGRMMESVDLVDHGLDNFRMTVPLVEGGESSHEVVILFPFDVPHKNTCAGYGRSTL